MHILSTIAAVIASAAFSIGSFFSPAPAPSFGAALPSATAVFETSLAAPISSSATSLTLTDNAVRGGGSISGYACFTLDEGSSQAEYACGTVSGTSVTGLTRGISPLTGTTTDADVQFSHRRGASVKITDFPLIQVLKAQANGEDTFPNILHYTSHPTFIATTDIPDKKYVDDIAFSGAGAVDATAGSRGVVELATGAEAAASTAAGSSGNLALPASIATSTYNSATAINVIPVTGGSGKVDGAFIATSTFYSANAGGGLASTTYVGSFPAYQIGKNMQVFTSTGTTTFTVPSGITKAIVEVQGAGGAGAGTAGTLAGGGGGAGGYCYKVVDLTSTTTVQVFVGTGGAGGAGAGPAGGWSTFGTNGFYCSASGGGGTSTTAGGTGGIGASGDLNLSGQDGGVGVSTSISGGGGTSHFGGGARGVACSAGGVSSQNYGGGGSGTCTSSGNNGGSGANGIVLVRW